jgi:hypothetical protein
VVLLTLWLARLIGLTLLFLLGTLLDILTSVAHAAEFIVSLQVACLLLFSLLVALV